MVLHDELNISNCFGNFSANPDGRASERFLKARMLFFQEIKPVRGFYSSLTSSLLKRKFSVANCPIETIGSASHEAIKMNFSTRQEGLLLS